MLRTALLSFVLAACAPTAEVGTNPRVQVPPDSPKTCAGYCTSMGLQLESVVVMANRVGCVCNAAQVAPPAPAPAASAGAAGAMTSIILDEEAAAASARNANH